MEVKDQASVLSLSPAAAVEQLASNSSGLSELEVISRRQRWGHNQLPQAKPLPAWRRWLRQLQDPFIYVLLASALISSGLQHWVDAGVILAVVGNVIRSLFLSYTANAKGTEALEAFHDTAGWSILIFTAAGVMMFSWVFGRLEKSLKLAEAQYAEGRPLDGSPGTDAPQRAA